MVGYGPSPRPFAKRPPTCDAALAFWLLNLVLLCAALLSGCHTQNSRTTRWSNSPKIPPQRKVAAKE